jgi:RimJ/RimL family protein N-acetyltransferase
MTASDASELYKATGDPEVMRYWASGGDQDIEQTRQRIDRINDHWTKHGFGDWGVIEKESGRLLGFSGLHHIADMVKVNIGYAFKKSKWRQGFGFETGQAVLDFGFRELCLSEVIAVIWSDNIASIKLAEKFGMIFWKQFTWGGEPHVAYSMSPEDWNHFQKVDQPRVQDGV